MTVRRLSPATATLIERDLALLFGRLDATTASVDTRKQLYAELAAIIITTARQRFPDNPHLVERIDRALRAAASPDDEPGVIVVAGQRIALARAKSTKEK